MSSGEDCKWLSSKKRCAVRRRFLRLDASMMYHTRDAKAEYVECCDHIIVICFAGISVLDATGALRKWLGESCFTGNDYHAERPEGRLSFCLAIYPPHKRRAA